MAEPITRVTLLVPGIPQGKKLRLGGSPDVEWVPNDGGFRAAFSFGTVGPDVLAALDATPGALVLHFPVDLRDGRETIVSAVERLRDAGAIAVRIEQSKLGWDVSRWLELFSPDDPTAWHRGAIAMLGDDNGLQSCGMHAFSLPDVQLADADAELASSLNIYQLDEDPLLRTGQTFATARDVPRRVVERWPDVRYPPSHACHNPYGVWRLGPPGGSARDITELQLVFMPALHVLLTALRANRDTPLTKEQVEAVRDQGVCMAMDPRDAQRLERERGYADLDPELVWEQWQLVQAL